MAVGLLLVGYWLLPELLVHAGHLGALVRAPGVERAIALTFDDGPGERTGEVLDLLLAYGGHATFFLVGEKAERHPDLLARILNEGHEVGVHGQRHVSFWLLGPEASSRQITEGRRTLERLVGHRLRLFRPPWGHVNVWALWVIRRERLRLTLWSVNSGDWLRRRSSRQIARAILRAPAGALVLLHDAGGDGRGRTVEALKLALPALQQQGVRLISVSELLQERRAPKGVLFRLWERWEALFGLFWGAIDVGEGDLLRLTRATWRGPEIVAPDGRRLRPGDTFLEVHFKNRELAELGAIRGLKRMRTSLEHLADLLVRREDLRHIDFLLGITVLAHPVALFGFHLMDLPPGVRTWWAGVYRRFLLRIYHPEGGKRLRDAHQDLTPKLVYITRAELLSRYGRREGARRGGQADESGRSS